MRCVAAMHGIGCCTAFVVVVLPPGPVWVEEERERERLVEVVDWFD